MTLITLYINSAERTRRTQVLARTTTDAERIVYGRNKARLGIGWIKRHHSDGLCGAVTLAVAAINIVGYNDTVLLHPYSVTNLNRRLFSNGNRLNRASGTHLRTLVTLGTAVALLV